MLCIMEIQAVLAQGDLKEAQARRGSKLLYESFKSQYQMVAFSAQDEEIVRWWLRSNHMAEWSLIRTWDREVWENYTEWITHEVGSFLASGWEIGMYIDSYDGATEPVRKLNVPTMRVSYPAHGPGFFDPERPPRPWATVGTDLGGDHGPG